MQPTFMRIDSKCNKIVFAQIKYTKNLMQIDSICKKIWFAQILQAKKFGAHRFSKQQNFMRINSKDFIEIPDKKSHATEPVKSTLSLNFSKE